MRRRAVLFAVAWLPAGLHVLPAAAAVVDPLQALKSFYNASKPKNATLSNARITTLYDWADRNLKRKLIANGVCTIPLRQREFACSLPFDPAFAGVARDLPAPDITAEGAGNERRVTATFNDEDMRFEVVYTFTRSGNRWELSEYEARPPQGKPWRLSELIPR